MKRTPPATQDDLPARQDDALVRPTATGIAEAVVVKRVFHERDALPAWDAVLGREGVQVTGAVEVVAVETGTLEV